MSQSNGTKLYMALPADPENEDQLWETREFLLTTVHRDGYISVSKDEDDKIVGWGSLMLDEAALKKVQEYPGIGEVCEEPDLENDVEDDDDIEMDVDENENSIVPDVEQVERHGYLFGHPIAHSMSPLLHQTVYDGLGLKWAQFPLDSLDMGLFLRLREDPRFYGKQPISLQVSKV